ncbi:MAG TPA: hypothetical protein VFS25_25265 [Chitinophaga sp.]|uniref:RNA polymerase sigma factor n=1 Tax=Chitinophaga sp. TaxID=1869181 RepID=UPI002DBABCE6|nr:hypothetical protein [Chitinophaga sp.]HEU4556182.1 hypothetical protein [Chitinophaga sp.]
MNSIDDKAVLSELKQGNIKAYQYFFLKYYKPLCLKAYTMLGNMRMAQDVVQHTFIRIWEQRLYLEIQQSVGGFLYQQVHVDCLKQLQQHPKNADDEKYQSKPNELADEQERKQMLSKLSELPTEKLKLVIEDPRIRFT